MGFGVRTTDTAPSHLSPPPTVAPISPHQAASLFKVHRIYEAKGRAPASHGRLTNPARGPSRRCVPARWQLATPLDSPSTARSLWPLEATRVGSKRFPYLFSLRNSNTRAGSARPAPSSGPSAQYRHPPTQPQPPWARTNSPAASGGRGGRRPRTLPGPTTWGRRRARGPPRSAGRRRPGLAAVAGSRCCSPCCSWPWASL